MNPTSQVHEIHPSHPFLSVPDQLSSVQGEADNEVSRRSLDMSGEQCKTFLFILLGGDFFVEQSRTAMLHQGVKCHQ